MRGCERRSVLECYRDLKRERRSDETLQPNVILHVRSAINLRKVAWLYCSLGTTLVSVACKTTHRTGTNNV